MAAKERYGIIRDASISGVPHIDLMRITKCISHKNDDMPRYEGYFVNLNGQPLTHKDEKYERWVYKCEVFEGNNALGAALNLYYDLVHKPLMRPAQEQVS
jgi:hypothetical protein